MCFVHPVNVCMFVPPGVDRRVSVGGCGRDGALCTVVVRVKGGKRGESRD